MQPQNLILIALMVVAFYFLIMRPQKKRQQAIAKTQSELGLGARVLLNSGVFGTILAIGPKQILLELSPGVEMTVLKQSIARVASEADEDVFVDSDEFDDDDDEVEGSDSLSNLDLPPLETAEEASARRAMEAEAEANTFGPQDRDDAVESDLPSNSDDDSYRPSSFSTSDPDPEAPRPNAN